MLEKHGSQMTAKEIRDAQRIEVHFGSVAIDRGGRGRGQPREPGRSDSQRSGTTMAGRRREGFGSALTPDDSLASGSVLTQNGRGSPVMGDVDPDTAR